MEDLNLKYIPCSVPSYDDINELFDFVVEEEKKEDNTEVTYDKCCLVIGLEKFGCDIIDEISKYGINYVDYIKIENVEYIRDPEMNFIKNKTQNHILTIIISDTTKGNSYHFTQYLIENIKDLTKSNLLYIKGKYAKNFKYDNCVLRVVNEKVQPKLELANLLGLAYTPGLIGIDVVDVVSSFNNAECMKCFISDKPNYFDAVNDIFYEYIDSITDTVIGVFNQEWNDKYAAINEIRTNLPSNELVYGTQNLNVMGKQPSIILYVLERMKDAEYIKEKELRLLEYRFQKHKLSYMNNSYLFIENDCKDKLKSAASHIKFILKDIEKEFDIINRQYKLLEYNKNDYTYSSDYYFDNHGLYVYNLINDFILEAKWALGFLEKELSEYYDYEELTNRFIKIFLSCFENQNEWIEVDKNYVFDYLSAVDRLLGKSIIFTEEDKDEMLDEVLEKTNIRNVYEIELIEDEDDSNIDLLSNLIDTVKGDEINDTIVIIKHAQEAIFNKNVRQKFITFLNNVQDNENIIIFFTCRDLYDLSEFYRLAEIKFGICDDKYYCWK